MSLRTEYKRKIVPPIIAALPTFLLSEEKRKTNEKTKEWERRTQDRQLGFILHSCINGFLRHGSISPRIRASVLIGNAFIANVDFFFFALFMKKKRKSKRRGFGDIFVVGESRESKGR